MEEFRSWFIDLWNHSIIPYLQEGAKDGIKVRNGPGGPSSSRAPIEHEPPPLGGAGGLPFHGKYRALILPFWYVATLQVHGQKAVWEDPVEWVRGTLPWPSAQEDQAKLFHLPPPSIGSSSPGQPLEERPRKETPPSSMESDRSPIPN